MKGEQPLCKLNSLSEKKKVICWAPFKTDGHNVVMKCAFNSLKFKSVHKILYLSLRGQFEADIFKAITPKRDIQTHEKNQSENKGGIVTWK